MLGCCREIGVSRLCRSARPVLCHILVCRFRVHDVATGPRGVFMSVDLVAAGLTRRACLPRTWLALVLACLMLGPGTAAPARAARSAFMAYDADQGLASVGGACMLQDRGGYILVCTEHGVFAYDGRRFVNLGTDQGLRQGGYVYGLALTSTGRVAVEYGDEVLVSDRASDASHPPTSLSFHSVLHPGLSFFDTRPHRLAPWRDGFVLIAGDITVRIVVPTTGAPRIETLGYDLGQQALLKGAVSVFSVRGKLWEAFQDGRLCAADPDAVKCYGAADGLVGGPWMDVIADMADGGDGVVARSVDAVATFDRATGRWSVARLPDQGDRYLNYIPHLGLFRAPDGSLVTQADHGLAILRHGSWQAVSVEDGAPAGTILSAMTDATGEFWCHVYGQGLVRWVGFGHWETLDKNDGLSEGIPWMSIRLPNGSMWLATDTGIDEIVRRGSYLRVGRVIPGSSFALAVGSDGRLWSAFGHHGARVIDVPSGSVTHVDGPPIDAMISGQNGTIWMGTETGLFRVDERAGLPLRPVFQGSPRAPVEDLVSDGAGGVFYLSGDHLRHRLPDGADVAVSGAWPAAGFEPLAMAFDHAGALWIGGMGGLFRFVLSDDHVVSCVAIPTSDTRTNSIAAVMVDHRGWVWAGSALGVSVFNGQRWVSVDADVGLLSNDVDTFGLMADPDGSVWIATSQGLSHLLDPAWLFTDRPLKAVVSGAMLGTRVVTGASVPYTKAALSVQFGTPSYGAERSVLFRYRLSGVDSGWAESSSGLVRYPFVPPGRHLLTVVGYDELTHRASQPAALLVKIRYPWWRQWWAETLCLLAVSGLAYGAMRIRFRTMLARQAELRRHVAAATAQLRYQAAHDSLTGLLTRSEVERRLAAKLSDGRRGDEIIIALIDIDHFKRVNDTHGHLAGDDVLRAMGRVVSKSVRPDEYAGRYGGEEILVVLDDTDGRGAERVLDLHYAIRGTPLSAGGKPVRVTCSIGLAWAVHGDDWESLIGRADDALYAAKFGGRDQIVEAERVTSDGRRVGPDGPTPRRG